MPSHANPAPPVTIDTQPLHEPDVAASAVNSATGAYDDGPALPRVDKVVLLMDLVESVRLMAQDESGAVARWTVFVQKANALIPRYNGRVVKSLGDGLLAEFNHSRDAVQVALALHQIIKPANLGRDPEQHLFLRVGINATPVYVGNNDIYGSGVNLAARLAGLAGPGETIVSASVRDQLTDGLDAEVDDMGECYLKHIAEPVRAYRVGPAGPRPVLFATYEDIAVLRPTLAIVPFNAIGDQPEQLAIGDLIADGVIGRLVRSQSFNVVTRLSTTHLRHRSDQVAIGLSGLNANYVMTGKYAPIARGSIGDQLLITCELIDTQHGHVIWSERFHGSVTDLLSLESETADRLAQSCHAALSRHEIEKAWVAPLETLAAYSLQMSGVYLLHSSNVRDFNQSSLILTALAERSSRLAEPLAWIGKWHVLRVVKGLSDDPQRDAQSALRACNSALARFPDLAAAHAIKGYVLSQNFSDSEASLQALEHALKLAPNDAQVWLYKSVWSQHWGNTGEAVNDALRARILSPLDPVGHFFDAVLCSALAFDRQYANAIEIAQRCLRLDRNHAPSLRTILLSQVESGDMLGAKTTARRLRLVSPNLSLASYKALGNANSQARLRVYEALKAVGF